MTPEFRAAVIRRLQTSLSSPETTWVETPEGLVPSAGQIAIELKDDDGGSTHVDIGIRLDRARADSPVIWDCVTGGGFDQPDEAADRAVHVWRQSGWAVVRELFLRTGESGEHFSPTDPDGLPGWHVILAPVIGWGSPPGDAESMQRWFVDHPPIRVLRNELVAILDPATAPHGVKLLIGGRPGNRIAEVRLDGRAMERASDALAGLDWPTPTTFGMARTYALFVHGPGH